MLATGLATMSGVVATVWKKSDRRRVVDPTSAARRPREAAAGAQSMEGGR
jgi:hypothetical protein